MARPPDPRLRPFSDIDMRAMVLIIEKSEGGSAFDKARLIAKIKKRYRQGRMFHGAKNDPQTAWQLCEARFYLGDRTNWNGWQYRSSWAAGWAQNLVKDGVPRWKGQRCKRLYIYGEQGIGDEVFFASSVRWIKTQVDSVCVETDQRLCPAFQRLGCETVAAVFEQREDQSPLRKMAAVDGDAWTLLGDTIVRAGPRPEPYLTADPLQIERFRQYRGRVGVSWRGNQGHYPASAFQVDHPLSLQYDQGWDEDIEQPEGLDLRNDIEGLLGLLANLRQVVTVSTSVAHLAAALGVATHVVIAPRNGPNSGMIWPWKWSNASTSTGGVWYRSATSYPSLAEYGRHHWPRHQPRGQELGHQDREIRVRDPHERPQLAESG